jgi:hypothetical protein
MGSKICPLEAGRGVAGPARDVLCDSIDDSGFDEVVVCVKLEAGGMLWCCGGATGMVLTRSVIFDCLAAGGFSSLTAASEVLTRFLFGGGGGAFGSFGFGLRPGFLRGRPAAVS